MTPDELRVHKQSHNKSNSYWLYDAKGIPLTRVCNECCQQIENSYPPEVLGISGNYEDIVEEQIEDDY